MFVCVCMFMIDFDYDSAKGCAILLSIFLPESYVGKSIYWQSVYVAERQKRDLVAND